MEGSDAEESDAEEGDAEESDAEEGDAELFDEELLRYKTCIACMRIRIKPLWCLHNN